MKRSLVRTLVRSAFSQGEDIPVFWLDKPLEAAHEELRETLAIADLSRSYEMRPVRKVTR